MPDPVEEGRSESGGNPCGVTPEEAKALLDACLAVCERWDLDAGQTRKLLGEPSPEIFQGWKRGFETAVTGGTFERLGHILAIHRLLRTMFVDPRRGYEWIKRANDSFGGRSALDVMLGGTMEDIGRVRNYLEAETGAQ